MPRLCPARRKGTIKEESSRINALGILLSKKSSQRLSCRLMVHLIGASRDKELLDRAADGVLYDFHELQGTPSHSLGRIHQYFLSCSATGTNREKHTGLT